MLLCIYQNGQLGIQIKLLLLTPTREDKVRFKQSMNLNRVFHVLFFSAAVCGFIYHVFYVNDQYFAYKTTTKVHSELRDVVKYPAIVWCTHLFQIISAVDLAQLNITSDDEIHRLTVKQLMDLTPAENETIRSCWLRGFSRSKHLYLEYTDCHNFFTIRKYILGSNVCFFIYPTQNFNYSIYQFANSISHGMDVYRIDFPETFKRGKQILIIAEYMQDDLSKRNFPIYSKIFAENLNRDETDNRVIVRSYQENYIFLPAPYETKCSLDSSASSCYRNCITSRAVSELGALPFSEPTNDYNERHILSIEDLRNMTVLQNWRQLENQCNNECSETPCEASMTLTMVDKHHHRQSKELYLIVSVPGMYAKVITSVPSMQAIEYLSSVTTCMSIWFGLSVLYFKPGNRCICLKKLKICFSLKWLYSIVCLAGFLYQLSQLSIQYLKYETGSKVDVIMTDEQDYQSLGFCLYYFDILQRSEEEWEDEFANMTVKEIFELTPGIRDIMRGCSFRDDFNFGLTSHDLKDCREKLDVVKFLRGTFVCYAFVPRNTPSFSWTKVGTSFVNQGQVYDVTLPVKLQSYIIVMLLGYAASSISPFPRLSRNFAQKLTPDSKINTITVASYRNSFLSLPPPYDTKCVHDYNQDECNVHCLAQSLSKIHRLSYSNTVKNSSLDIKILSVRDVQKDTLSHAAWLAIETCNKKCSLTPCFADVSFTDISGYHDPENEGYLKLISMVPTKPALMIYSIASTNPTDFFLYICNCFGIWFGLSFLTLKSLSLPKMVRGIRRKVVINIGLSLRFRINILSIMQGLVFFVCVSGFSWHAFGFIETYFKYKTGNKIEIAGNNYYRLPNVVFCTRYSEVIAPDVWFTHVGNKSQPTIREIFEMTPNSRDVFVGCSYRFNKTEGLRRGTQEECHSFWAVFKYTSGAEICYTFYLNQEEPYRLIKISSALNNIGIIYKLYLNESLMDSQHITLISTTDPLGITFVRDEILPIRSRKYSEVIYRELTDKAMNYFLVQGTIYDVTLLPAPYDTHCLPGNLADLCEPNCNIQYKKEKLGRVPFHEIITDISDDRMVSQEDLKNQTIRNIIREGNEECRKKCRHHACDSYYSLTEASGFFKPSLGSELVLAAGIPRSNGLIVKTFPLMPLINFVNNLAVSASIWFGVSVLSLVMFPVKLLKSWSQKRKLKSLRRVGRSQRLKGLDRKIKITPRNYCRCLYCQKFLKE